VQSKGWLHAVIAAACAKKKSRKPAAAQDPMLEDLSRSMRKLDADAALHAESDVM
jgi:hypothetical protein